MAFELGGGFGVGGGGGGGEGVGFLLGVAVVVGSVGFAVGLRVVEGPAVGADAGGVWD